MFLILFLFLGGFFIISNENIKLDNSENVSVFLKSYGEWLDSLTGNSKVVAGYVVKMDWLPDKSSEK